MADLLEPADQQDPPASPAAVPARRGRPTGPTKLTKKTRDLLVQAIEMGTTYLDAAAYAGIHYTTLHHWLRQGEQQYEAGDSTGDFYHFFEAIKKAEGKMVMRLQAKIERAATQGDWHAAAWKLERRYPDRYGRTVQDQRFSGQVKVQHDNLTHSILSNPAASKAATDLVAELAGAGYSQDDPGWDSLDNESETLAIGPAPETD